MGQVFRILLTFLFLTCFIPAFAAVTGGIEYQIPIDYSKLDEQELVEKAEYYYNFAIKLYNGKINDEMTSALNLYKILNSKCPDNQQYALKLGSLYDIIGKDRFAKGCFYQAIGIDETKPAPYFYLGEFYYRRCAYKHALKFYKRAYTSGYTRHYETAYKLGDIYEKLGDTEASLKYLKLASELSPNTELDNKILRVENAHKINKEYYSNTRIHY